MNQRQLQVIDYLREENRVLREQLGGRRLRLDDNQRRRLAVRAKVLGRTVLAEIASVVTPETLLAWHRKLIAQKCDGTAHRAAGRPRIAGEIEDLVVRMAEENRDWGYRRIEGALSNLGHEAARSTIAQIPERHGIEPAPERIRKTTWKEFLSRHWEVIVATDFFTVEVWTKRGEPNHQPRGRPPRKRRRGSATPTPGRHAELLLPRRLSYRILSNVGPARVLLASPSSATVAHTQSPAHAVPACTPQIEPTACTRLYSYQDRDVSVGGKPSFRTKRGCVSRFLRSHPRRIGLGHPPGRDPVRTIDASHCRNPSAVVAKAAADTGHQPGQSSRAGKLR